MAVENAKGGFCESGFMLQKITVIRKDNINGWWFGFVYLLILDFAVEKKRKLCLSTSLRTHKKLACFSPKNSITRTAYNYTELKLHKAVILTASRNCQTFSKTTTNHSRALQYIPCTFTHHKQFLLLPLAIGHIVLYGALTGGGTQFACKF